MRSGFFALGIINVSLRVREQKSIRLLQAREMNNCFIARFVVHGLISSFGNDDVINV